MRLLLAVGERVRTLSLANTHSRHASARVVAELVEQATYRCDVGEQFHGIIINNAQDFSESPVVK